MYGNICSLITTMVEDMAIAVVVVVVDLEVEVDSAMMVVGGVEEAEDEDILVISVLKIRAAKD